MTSQSDRFRKALEDALEIFYAKHPGARPTLEVNTPGRLYVNGKGFANHNPTDITTNGKGFATGQATHVVAKLTT